MSLQVEARLIEQAEAGFVDPKDFLDTIKTSLPHAWEIVDGLVQRKASGEKGLVEFAPKSLDDEKRGQLLRAMASNSIRTALEDYAENVLGGKVSLAFQNCHRTGIFTEGEEEVFQRFTSIEAQILNQSPEMRDC
jgi:hypothetical protein